MAKVPVLHHHQILAALRRDGWFIARHRGTSHIQLHKHIGGEVLRVSVPAHSAPVKHSTLAKILKKARLDLDRFLELL